LRTVRCGLRRSAAYDEISGNRENYRLNFHIFVFAADALSD
jgi:hypothetical protein